MRRRFNYTGRKKILQRDISITLMQDESGSIGFCMDLTFQNYDFPPDSHIWIEAYDKNSVERFDFGKVEDAAQSKREQKVSLFSGTDNFLFRVKIVDGEDRSKLLGLAKHVSPIGIREDNEPGQSLLKVGIKSLDGRPWKLEYDAADYPTIYVDSDIEAGVSLARTNTFFQSVVFPSVMEDILRKILVEEEYTPSGDPEPEDIWKEGWLDFAASMPGNTKYPTDEDWSLDEKQNWIESSIVGFCRNSNSLRKLRVALKEIEI
ncbi:MAG: hypothetical protein NUV80_05535 [Candidatus Berkelbacteria bacterium]|nr:hypothetical protein [Candidatus Berkelbacteria bacterium]